MSKKTSAEAYEIIKDNGLLSAKRFEVYSIIYENAPVNCRQIIKIASKGKVTNTGAISGRLSELESCGVIYNKYEAPCPDTGYMTIFWDVTTSLPLTPKRKPTKQETIKKLEIELADTKKVLKKCVTILKRNKLI